MINMEWDEKHVIDFGKKHKGKTLAVIADTDPSYILWLKDGANKPISRKLYDECQEQLREMAEENGDDQPF